MYINIVDAKTNEDVFSCYFDGTMPAPNKDDIVVDPVGLQYRVLQRAFIVRNVADDSSVIDLLAPKKVDVEVQCAVCPVGLERQYIKELTGCNQDKS